MKWFKTTSDLKALCPKLAEARVSAGLSQEEVGVRIGTHQTVISKIDSGKLSDTIGEALAKALVDYATAMSLPVPELVETGKRTLAVTRSRPSRERRVTGPTKGMNEAAMRSILSLVREQTLEVDAALSLMKTL